MNISPTATFRDPLPADYGRAEQMKRMTARKALEENKDVTPPAAVKYLPIELTFSIVGKERQIGYYEELKRRALIQPLAEQAWAELTPFYRGWLALRGETPMSYFEAHR